MRSGRIRIGFEIFQTAQVILISHVENIIRKNIEVENHFVLPVGESCSKSRINECIARGRRFGIVGQVGAVLRPGKGRLHAHKSIHKFQFLIGEIILQL